MSPAAKLIEELSQSGVLLAREGDKLVLDGPEALLTETLVEKLRALKPEIFRAMESDWGSDWQAYFDERAAMAESARLARQEAEARAFESCVVEVAKSVLRAI